MKMNPTFTARPLALALLHVFGATALLAAPLAHATPQGGTVTSGQASIRQGGNLTTVTQGSQRAVIDWRSFNVGAQETVNFIQPNTSAAVLNRVTGNDPSAIFGRITANGQVYLINPNGILFGRTAQVDVGALTASTSNVGNADFMAGRLNFSEPGKAGARVENEGRITVADGGFVALAGRQVANSGVISARLGKVALAAGDAFVLDLYGDRLVNLVVDPAALATLTDAGGQPLAASVNHSGEIVAAGGRVELSVATVKRLVDNLVNVSGVVRATSFTSAPGVISLHGDANTNVAVGGTLDTSGERGGRIEVTGRDVSVQSGAVLAATGGQGSIAVGGDWQGRGPLAHADTVTVAQGAVLDAGGGAQGQGGTVVLWSGKDTQFGGRISVAGGTHGGDAGQAEVSSKGRLGFLGDVDLFAAKGKQGSLLLDPFDLTIGTVTSGDSQISADQLRYLLVRGGNVSLSADHDVTVDAEVNALVTGGTGTAGGGLTLTAGNNLTVNQNIVLNDGALSLTATSGALTQAAGTVLYTGSGNATLRGGSAVDLGQLAVGGAVDIRSGGTLDVRNAIVSASANGTAAPVASLNVEGVGAVTLNGALVQGDASVRSTVAGVSLAGAVVRSVGGNVDVNAATTIGSSAANVGLMAAGTLAATAGQGIDLGVVMSDGTATLDAGGAVTVRQAVTGASAGATQGLQVEAGGAVSLAGANAGAGGIGVTAAGDITSQGADAAQGGLVSAGTTTLHSTAGRVGTSTNSLRVQSTGNIDVAGQAGVHATTVLGAGTIALGSAAGTVTVTQAIAAQAGAVGEATTARPTSVIVSGRDGVDVAGAVAGTGGIAFTSSAGAVTVRNSLFSQGTVTVQSQGALNVLDGAGLVTSPTDGAAGRVALTSTAGTVTLGNAGIRTEGGNVAIAGQTGVQLNGDVQVRGGAISVASAGGAVRALAADSGNDPAANATLDAGTDAVRSTLTVSAAGDVELGELIAYNSIDIGSTNGNVVLRRGLGGNASGTFAGNPVLLNTGYVDYARGYLSQYRPNVGRLTITAGNGSVELNGLNLDGNANAGDTTTGLSITAGRRIVSNREIAVNKGDIVLTGGSTQATDGVYLGNSVYSRGFDSVGADGVRGGSDDVKVGYGIRIAGRVLGLFDNTVEMAQLPVNTFIAGWYESVNGNPVLHQYRTDAAGFVVDTAGLRVRNPDGSFQLVGMLPGSAETAADLAVFNVDANQVIVAGNPNAGVDVVSVRGAPAVADAQGRAQLMLQEVAKIEVANNVANYQDVANAGTLVAATSGTAANRLVQVNTTTIAGVANHTPQTAMRLGDPAPVLTAPSQAPIVSAPTQAGVVAATRGIGLKLLGFRETGDVSSGVWGSTIDLISAGGGDPFFFRFDGASFQALSMTNLPSTAPVDGRFTVTVPALATRTYVVGGSTVTQFVQLPPNSGTVTHHFRIVPSTNGGPDTAVLESITPNNVNLSSLSATAPAGATQVSAWTATGWHNTNETATLRIDAPSLVNAGTANGVRVTASLYPATGTPLLTGAALSPTFLQQTPDRTQPAIALDPVLLNPIGGIPQTFYLSGVQSDALSSVTAAARAGTRVFVYDGVINTSNGAAITDSNTGVAIPGLGGIPGFNNSTVGFAGVGAGFGSLAGGTAGSTGVGGSSGQGAGGVSIPGGQTGTGTAPPPPPSTTTATFDDRTAQDAATDGLNVAGGPGLPDLVFGVRPAAEADFGRGASVQGSAINVFKRRYRLATAPSGTVCAPDSVQPTAPADGQAARECPAGK